MNVRPALLGRGERAGIVAVPVLRLKLVNVPRRSEDPRLARGNDNPGGAGRPDHLGDVQ